MAWCWFNNWPPGEAGQPWSRARAASDWDPWIPRTVRNATIGHWGRTQPAAPCEAASRSLIGTALPATAHDTGQQVPDLRLAVAPRRFLRPDHSGSRRRCEVPHPCPPPPHPLLDVGEASRPLALSGVRSSRGARGCRAVAAAGRSERVKDERDPQAARTICADHVADPVADHVADPVDGTQTSQGPEPLHDEPPRNRHAENRSILGPAHDAHGSTYVSGAMQRLNFSCEIRRHRPATRRPRRCTALHGATNAGPAASPRAPTTTARSAATAGPGLASTPGQQPRSSEPPRLPRRGRCGTAALSRQWT